MKQTTWKLAGSVALIPLSLLGLRFLKQDFFLLGLSAGIVLTILYSFDIGREPRSVARHRGRSHIGHAVIAIPQLLIGLTCSLTGVCLLAWIGYNVLVERSSNHIDGSPLMGAGMGIIFIVFGSRWLKRSLGRIFGAPDSGVAPEKAISFNEPRTLPVDADIHNPQNMLDEAERHHRSGNYSLCFDSLLRLSANGNARASLLAATILDSGGDGIASDPARARVLYATSLTQAFSPGAALGLALMCYRGRGGEKDFAAARKYFKMIPGGAFPLIMLGVMSQKGYGCEPNEEEALRYYEKAWALGHPIGLKNASIIRFHRHEYFRATVGFVRSGKSIFLNYGLRKLPLHLAPKRVRTKKM